MNLGNLKKIVKDILDDDREFDANFSNAELLELANDAESEACRRKDLLIDSTTAATSTITIVSGTRVYAVSALVLDVLSVILASGTRPLTKYTQRTFELTNPTWRSDATGPPRLIIPDETGKVLLHPTPNANSTLTLTVARLPLVAMSADASVPEIESKYHQVLTYWMLHRAYQKQDSEVLDKGKIKLYADKFTAELGERKKRWMN